ncbi:MAG TPA: dTDP-4-dehydrorhamnose 3,5-epimerase [Stenomitos sp.]
MNVIQTGIPGLIVIEPKAFGDPRGFFLETYAEHRYQEAGITPRFVQANHSRSRRGVLRGLHYQLIQPQGKLVYVARGAVYDVAVDIRRGSPTFGKHHGVVLDDQTHRQMYVPPGFAHGFVVLSEECDFLYQVTDYYHPASEHGIAWDDPALGIEWPISDVLLSDKDRQHPTLANQAPEKLPVWEATTAGPR